MKTVIAGLVIWATVLALFVVVSNASAHDAVCGSIKDAGRRASCRLSYIRSAAKGRYDVRSGHRPGGYSCKVGYSPDWNGPHSFAGRFNCVYTQGGFPFKTYRCIGSVRVSAHTGKAVRWRNASGAVLTGRTVC